MLRQIVMGAPVTIGMHIIAAATLEPETLGATDMIELEFTIEVRPEVITAPAAVRGEAALQDAVLPEPDL